MTTKQRTAIKNMVENGGKKGKAMLDAGYSKAMAKNPQKLFNSKAVQNELRPLLKRENVTIEQYVMNVGQAMQADKMNQFTGEITPDYGIRLSANKQAERFLFKKNDTEPINQTLKQYSNESDEVELQRLVFRKTQT